MPKKKISDVQLEQLAGLSDRLREIRRILGITQAQMAERLGVSNSFQSEVEKGKTKPGYDFIYSIHDALNINLHYLLMGTGDIFCSGTGEYVEIEVPGEQIENIGQVLWYAKRSRMANHSILGLASKFFIDSKEYISKEIGEKEMNKIKIKGTNGDEEKE